MTHDPSSYRLIFLGDFEANGLKSLVLRPDDLMHHTASKGSNRRDGGVNIMRHDRKRSWHDNRHLVRLYCLCWNASCLAAAPSCQRRCAVSWTRRRRRDVFTTGVWAVTVRRVEIATSGLAEKRRGESGFTPLRKASIPQHYARYIDSRVSQWPDLHSEYRGIRTCGSRSPWTWGAIQQNRRVSRLWHGSRGASA